MVTRLGEFSPIGRLFTTGSLSLTKESQILAIFFTKNNALAQKYILGYILDDFSTNSSGHPAVELMHCRRTIAAAFSTKKTLEVNK
jgi:hypothetical protein